MLLALWLEWSRNELHDDQCTDLYLAFGRKRKLYVQKLPFTLLQS